MVTNRPAGGSFTVELAENRAFTTLSYGGSKTSPWGDGQQHPVNYSITNLGGAPISDSGCISSPNRERALIVDEKRLMSDVLALCSTCSERE